MGVLIVAGGLEGRMFPFYFFRSLGRRVARQRSTAMTANRNFCTEKVAKKVLYEIRMFNFLCDEPRLLSRESVTFQPGDVTLVGTGFDSVNEDWRTFALLESFLLHTRVLHDFFYKRREQDDVIASDFVPDWESRRLAKGEYLKDRKKRLDKAIAHLTLQRVEYDGNEKKWNVDAIQAEIGIAIKQFRQFLPVESKQWF
jgi:hypothetical protein